MSNPADFQPSDRIERDPRNPSRSEADAYDDNGVDRTQIRQLLALSPAEQLANPQEFMDSVDELWRLNGIRPVR